MTKPRNAEDATRRNVRAANKKLARLEARVKAIEQTLKALANHSRMDRW